MSVVGGGQGVTVAAPSKATAAVIFLHGLGDTASGWSPAFPLQGLDHVKTVLPTADRMPVSLNMGMVMPSWFDLHGLDENARDDEEGIMKAVARVNRIIDEQVANGIPSERIIVGGFSQGGAVALTVALCSERKLAGAVVLSGWLPLFSTYPGAFGPYAKAMPMLMCHGESDGVVDFRFGLKSHAFLVENKIDVEFKSYRNMGHGADPAELLDVAKFLRSTLPPIQ